MGVFNEDMRQILVRASVNTMEIADWTQIPGDTEPVTVRLVDEEARSNGGELRFIKQKDVSFGQVWIDDIEGTLVTTDDWYDSNHPRFAFVRDEEAILRVSEPGRKWRLSVRRSILRSSDFLL